MYRILPYVVLALWMLAMLASLQAALAPATGSGFTLGADRAVTVIGWQFLATGLAVILWRYGRGWPPGQAMRRLSLLPLLVALSLALYVLIRVAFALAAAP